MAPNIIATKSNKKGIVGAIEKNVSIPQIYEINEIKRKDLNTN